MKGLMVSIFESKDIGNCSLGGLSKRYKSAVLVGEDIAEIIESNEQMPAIKLVKRIILGKEYMHCEPVDAKSKWYSMGGCFVWSSDSRFPNDYPLPLHDRAE